jgi:hypothetical protein
MQRHQLAWSLLLTCQANFRFEKPRASAVLQNAPRRFGLPETAQSLGVPRRAFN